jgi:hypothetical protein
MPSSLGHPLQVVFSPVVPAGRGKMLSEIRLVAAGGGRLRQRLAELQGSKLGIKR